MIPTQEEIVKAVKILRLALKEDTQYFYSWQANIAMSIYDEYNRQIGEDCAPTDSGVVLKVANDGAKNFLDLLINEG